MKFSTYQQQVNPNTSNARVVAPARPLVHNQYTGDGGRSLQQLAGALGNLAGIVQKRQDENDAADVAKARAEISQQLNNTIYGEEGILATSKGENYKGLSVRVTDEVKNATADVSKNYNGRVQKILQEKYLPEDLMNYGRMGMQHETKERENYHTAQYSTGMNNLKNKIAMNYADEQMMESGMIEVEQTLKSRGNELGWDGSALESARTSAYTDIFKSTLDTALANDDYENGEKLLKKFRKHLDPDVYAKSYKVFNERRKNNENYRIGKEIVSQCYNPETGETDWEKFNKAIEEAAGYSAGGKDYEAMTQKGYEAFKGQTMLNKDKGCVEGVVKIGSYVNPWFNNHQGLTNVDDLIAAAKDDPNGPKVIPFDEKNTNAGDVIVYADSNNVTRHVVMAAGGKSYVGNSTRQQMIVKGSDYNEMGSLHPYLLIKTGGKNEGPRMGDMERMAHIKQYATAELNMQANIRKEEHNKIIDGFEKRMLGGDYSPELLNEIKSSKLDTDEKIRLSNAFRSPKSGGSGRRGGGGGSRGGSGSSGKYSDYQQEMDIVNLSNWQEDSESVDQKTANAAAFRYNQAHGLGGLNGDNLNDPRRWSLTTDLLEAGYTKQEAMQKMISWGWSETEADWYTGDDFPE